MNSSSSIIQEIEKSEEIGYVSSPSSTTEIKVTIAGHAYQDKLAGNFCIIYFQQGGNDHITIAQILSVERKNPYLERHSIEKILSERGQAEPLTEKHDVMSVVLVPQSTYKIEKKNGKIVLIPSTLSTVMPTGTKVYKLNKNVIDMLIQSLSYSPNINITYIGKIYNSNILLPTVFRHFGDVDKGGMGESYHIGIFGKTGCGKSVLAKEIILSYAKNIEMSILCLDPNGEYEKELSSKDSVMRKVIEEKLKRKFSIFNFSNIALTSYTALRKILLLSGNRFLDIMGIRAEENREYAADVIIDFFKRDRHDGSYGQKSVGEYTKNGKENISKISQSKFEIADSLDKNVFYKLIEYIKNKLGRIYKDEKSQDRVKNILSQEEKIEELYDNWKAIISLFDTKNKTTLDGIIEKLVKEREIVILNISETSSFRELFWSSDFQYVIIEEILDSLVRKAEELWRKSNKSLNTLVVIDEAHRLVPRGRVESEILSTLRNKFIDAVRTTRKYGLGWMFISQSLASIHPEILRQLRVYFFGYGLSFGSERRALEELVGGGMYIDLYSTFKDPQTMRLMNLSEYPFMIYGPVSPLSTSGTPIFILALDYEKEFIKENFK